MRRRKESFAVRGLGLAEVIALLGTPVALGACHEPFYTCYQRQTCPADMFGNGGADAGGSSGDSNHAAAGGIAEGSGGAAGGGNDGVGGAPAPDTVPPAVKAITPIDGAMAVAPNTSIVLTFSEPMDAEATAKAISISPLIACKAGWTWSADGLNATCVPDSELAAMQKYEVRVDTGAKDLAGLAMMSAFTASFTTSEIKDTTPPIIEKVTPAHQAVGEALDTNIVVTFSEPMDLATTELAFKMIEPPAAQGVITWSEDHKTLTFDPKDPMPHGQVVKFQVSAAAKDMAGNAKATADNYEFSVLKKDTKRANCIAALDGYVVNGGGVDTTAKFLKVGDQPDGKPVRAFLAFSLAEFPAGASVLEATVFAYLDTVVGSPLSGLGGSLIKQHIDIGNYLDSWAFEGYDIAQPMGSGGYFLTDSNVGWRSVVVTHNVQNDMQNRETRGNRSQFRLMFKTMSDGDGQEDSLEFSSCNAGDAINPRASLYRPYLNVTYEYP